MQTITSLIVCIYCGHSRWWSQDRYNKVAATTVAPLIVFQVCKLTVFATLSAVHTTSSQVEGDLGVSWIFNTWLLLKMEKTHEWKRSYLRTYSFWDIHTHTVRKQVFVTLPCFSQAFHVCWHLLYIIAFFICEDKFVSFYSPPTTSCLFPPPSVYSVSAPLSSPEAPREKCWHHWESVRKLALECIAQEIRPQAQLWV